MANKISFCYLEPDFPNKIFIAFIFMRGEGNIILYPLFETFLDIDRVRNTLMKLKKDIEKRNADIDAYGGLVVTLRYDHNFPLKKEYWDPSNNSNSNKDIRMMAFLKMLDGPYQFFRVIITPQSYDDKTKTWKLTSWLPVMITSTDEQIGALIKSSDQSVEYRAKNIGMYSVVKVQGFDTRTGKLVKPKQNTIQRKADC